jgi:hypothetical protein
LIVVIDGKEWDFSNHCLSSGGGIWFGDDGSENIDEGEWEIVHWPEGFPEEYKEATLDKVNQDIMHGCCGGCI